MGIRVNKRIGYGLDNVLWSKKGKYGWELTDPRFDIDKWNGMLDTGITEANAEDFLKWCKDHKKEIAEVSQKDLFERITNNSREEEVMSEFMMLEMFLKNDYPRKKEFLKKDFYSTFTCKEEYGIKEVFLIEPFSVGERWHRYDDAIDWEEETKSNNQNNHYEWISWSGIYPYNSGMIRFRGKLPDKINDSHGNKFLDNLQKGRMDVQHYSMLVGYWNPPNVEPMAKGEFLEDLKENWRCRIPIEIYAQLMFMGCIKDVASFVDELRPMLYVYWG